MTGRRHAPFNPGEPHVSSPTLRVAPPLSKLAASAFCFGASGPFQRPLLMVKCALKFVMIEVLEKPGSARSEGPPFVHLANQKFPLCVCARARMYVAAAIAHET